MKSKKLIQILQELDPTGEIEVCVANTDIFDVEAMGAYYDGKLETLLRDSNDDIIGGKYHTKGEKINLITMSIAEAYRDAVYRNEDFRIDYTELSKEQQVFYRRANEQSKKAMISMQEKVEFNLFRFWCRDKIKDKYPGSNSIDDVAEEFFMENLSYSCPFPPGQQIQKIHNGSISYRSYADRREEQWDKEIEISFDGFGFSIKRIVGTSMKPIEKFIPDKLQEKTPTIIDKLKGLFF